MTCGHPGGGSSGPNTHERTAEVGVTVRRRVMPGDPSGGWPGRNRWSQAGSCMIMVPHFARAGARAACRPIPMRPFSRTACAPSVLTPGCRPTGLPSARRRARPARMRSLRQAGRVFAIPRLKWTSLGWRCRRVLLSWQVEPRRRAFGDLHGTAILARSAKWRKQHRERTSAQAPHSECRLRTVPRGRGMRRYPAPPDGHCWTAADLMARPGVRAATGSADWPPPSRVGGCHGRRQFAKRHRPCAGRRSLNICC